MKIGQLVEKYRRDRGSLLRVAARALRSLEALPPEVRRIRSLKNTIIALRRAVEGARS